MVFVHLTFIVMYWSNLMYIHGKCSLSSLCQLQYGAVPLEVAATKWTYSHSSETVGGRSQRQPSEQGDDSQLLITFPYFAIHL